MMTRFGWIMLLTIMGVVGAFLLMLSPESEVASSVATSAPARLPAEARVGTPSGLIVPVAGVPRNTLTNTWGDARGGGSRRHKAIDIMAPHGTPVVAVAPGRVEKLFDSQNGGRTVYVRSSDGRIVFYYAHLDAYHPTIAEGRPVQTGDVIGTVGSTGSASEDAPHLHFEVKRMAPGERWHQGQELNPYPLLAGRAAGR